MAGAGARWQRWTTVLSRTPSEQFMAFRRRFRHGGVGRRMAQVLRTLAPSRGTASTGEGYKSFHVRGGQHALAAQLLLQTAATQPLTAADPVGCFHTSFHFISRTLP